MLQPEIAAALDARYGPIVTTFTVTSVPDGGAPLEIRQEWLETVLPVRALHAKRFYFGYPGRRFNPLAEDHAVDALTGERPKFPVWGNIEVRGYDAVESLRAAGRLAAVEFWTPYVEAMLGFEVYDGRLSGESVPAHIPLLPSTPSLPKVSGMPGRLVEDVQLPE